MRALLIALLFLTVPAAAHPVLMISIDGLRSKDVTDAPARGMKLPNLSRLMTDGAWADGVRDVLPSVTYPNHTTLVTGVAPAIHGIAGNLSFDPFGKNMEAWYWYAEDVKVPSLFDVVHAKGARSLAFGWPATVGSLSITDNIPEYWRAYTQDDVKVVRAVSTPGMAERINKISGTTFKATLGVTLAADMAKAKAAAAIIAADHPLFSAVHLSSLDETEHEHGPDTPQKRANLEALDDIVGTLVAAARKAQPDLVVALVSDHGFAAISHDVNMVTAFVEAGLVTLDKGKVKDWQAMPWYQAGSDIIVLKDRNDAAVKEKVAALLKKLAADPKNGIAGVIDRAEIAKRGGAKEADFWVSFAPGFKGGKALTGPLITPSVDKGTHGYFPDWDAMRSTFLIAGPDVPKKALGEIDMHDIAPTVAKIMDVKLPAATGKPLF
ncbi:MAG: alkaline phosphatase family protein [Alphaproteobacteria bacterium]|nr:alkaline phosphatase family protein [Alphaproteobacteria bacterium]